MCTQGPCHHGPEAEGGQERRPYSSLQRVGRTVMNGSEPAVGVPRGEGGCGALSGAAVLHLSVAFRPSSYGKAPRRARATVRSRPGQFWRLSNT